MTLKISVMTLMITVMTLRTTVMTIFATVMTLVTIVMTSNDSKVLLMRRSGVLNFGLEKKSYTQKSLKFSYFKGGFKVYDSP